MSAWLYQMNQADWPPEVYRYEIREKERWRWPYRSKRGRALLRTGDTLVFFYAPAGGRDPGFYGWAVVERWDEEERLVYFTPVAPSDHLKMDPWWSDDAKKIADEVRGRMAQATLFLIPEKKLAIIRRGIRSWLRPRE
jgi:hypothetical protein